MKKIIATTVMILIGLASYSQNLIGESFRDVKKTMNEKGFILREGYTDESKIYYLLAYDNAEIRVYYFNASNTCIVYEYSPKNVLRATMEQGLFNAGYHKNTNGDYDSENYTAMISYSQDNKSWVVTMILRQK